MSDPIPLDDPTALRRYAATRDPQAFAWLVHRHIDAVYSAAQRQVNDPGLAEDVTQAVFILLSKNAGRLKSGTVLIGWLLQAAHFVCRDARKREARRRFHETKATLMRNTHTEPPGQAIEADWDALRPHLDEALMGLGTASRAAVALRYFENRPLKEIGEALGISEEAARKRVDRALEQLRKGLAGKGILAPTALEATLIATSAQAAPTTLAAVVFGPATHATTALAMGGARLLFWAQFKFAAAIAASFLILTTAATIAVVSETRRAPAPSSPIAIAAPTRAMPLSPDVLTAPIYRAQLIDPAGQGVANAAVRVYWNQSHNFQLEWSGQTGAEGRFATGPLPPMAASEDHFPLRGEEKPAQRILVFDVPGYALTCWWPQTLSLITDPTPPQITLRRAAPVSGTVTDAQGHPVPGAIVEASVSPREGRYFDPRFGGYFDFNKQTGFDIATDAQGHFRFDRIADNTRMHLTVRHPDYCTWSTQSGGDFDYPIAVGTNDLEVQLANDPATIRAQLTQNGKPVAKSGVLITAALGSGQSEIQPTDAAGHVEFRGLAAGSWTLSNVLSNTNGAVLFSTPSPITLGPRQQQEVSLELGTVAVHGMQLETDSNEPIRTTVFVNSPNGARRLAKVNPDAAGHFELLLPPGQYQLRSTSSKNGVQSYVNQPLTIAPTDSAMNVTLSLHDVPNFRGRLIDSNGKPLAGVVVIANGPATSFGPDVTAATAGADGHFAMHLLASAFDMAGKPTIAFAMDSSRQLGRGFLLTMPEPDSPDVDLVLEPMGAITGKVLDQAGWPAINAQLGPEIDASWDFQAGTHTNKIEDSYTIPDWIWKSTIDANGDFRIAPVPVGYKLKLHMQIHDQWANTRIGLLDRGETLDLGTVNLQTDADTPPSQAWDATITGRVLDTTGKPIVGTTLSVHIPAGGNGMSTLLPDNLQTVSDLKGRFSIAGLPRDRLVIVRGNLHNGTSENNWKVTPGPAPIDLTPPLNSSTDADHEKAFREAVKAARQSQPPAATLP